MGLPAKELSLRGPQVQILSPPQKTFNGCEAPVLTEMVGTGAFVMRGQRELLCTLMIAMCSGDCCAYAAVVASQAQQ